jgi:hypothetical protein
LPETIAWIGFTFHFSEQELLNMPNDRVIFWAQQAKEILKTIYGKAS